MEMIDKICSLPKALVLLSGGLDSSLVIGIMLKQGIQTEAINFVTPFCTCTRGSGCRLAAKTAALKFGVPLKVLSIGREYIKIIKNPKYGYGKNMNPCIDCRILIFKKAKEYMKKAKASFIVTGEVLGQRPMSQHLKAMKIIEEESGLSSLVLRPLSAKLLEPTLPEKEGLVNREELLNISGRTRKPQMQLAEVFGLKDYPCPAGGCLLTDPAFARRMADLLKFTRTPTLNDIQLLKIGRHFRLGDIAKVIVGRNEHENKILLTLSKEKDIKLAAEGEKGGPVVIIRGKANRDDLLSAAAICARYSDDKGKDGIRVMGQEGILNPPPVSEKELERLRI
jgi:tRNA U34 2-thiouridine synthase MnmA/TrmU